MRIFCRAQALEKRFKFKETEAKEVESELREARAKVSQRIFVMHDTYTHRY
jgi:hypothetical protein